ncbi:MAG: tRNA pseudouridine(38-40) synthase TruA [Flavobacteriales bacterium]|jgi:tRNA pseudouridine38-40 synthase
MMTEPIETTENDKPLWKRYFMHISYDGTNYHGWQRQLNSHSVQEEIEGALRKLLRQERVVSVGCGRTDSGVHARDFYLHFNAEKPIENKADIFFKLNMLLPKDIGLYGLWQVDYLAHARFDANERSYEYHIHQKRDPFIERFSTFYPWELDVPKMNEAAQLMLNYSDFAAFCKTGGGQKTTLCDLRKAYWVQDDYKLVFHITADRFLRNMVRAVVGTLIEVGRGKITLEQFQAIVEGGKRTKAGESVPPQGLHLTRINYPEEKIREVID